MIEARSKDACRYPGILAECLRAWATGEESIDAKTAAMVMAETVILWRQSVMKR